MSATHEDVVRLGIIVREEESSDRRHVGLILRASCLDESVVGLDRRRRVVQWPCEPSHHSIVEVEDGFLDSRPEVRRQRRAHYGRTKEDSHCHPEGMVQSRRELKAIVLSRKR